MKPIQTINDALNRLLFPNSRWTTEEQQSMHRMILAGAHPEALFIPHISETALRKDWDGDVLGRFIVTEIGIYEATEQQLLEADEEEVETTLASGGVVTLSSDISKVKDETVFANIKRHTATQIQRILRGRKTVKAISSVKKEIGFTIGNFCKGRYVDKEGNIFDEKSFSVDIADVSSEELRNIASALRSEFNQNSVLVYDRGYVDPKKPNEPPRLRAFLKYN